MRKIQFALGLVLVACFSGLVNAQISTAGKTGDGVFSIAYYPETGGLVMENDGTAAVTTFELVASEELFVVDNKPTALLGGLFDVFTGVKLFKLDPAGYSDLDWGPVLKPGLTADELGAKLKLSGSHLGGGALAGDLRVVPEPSSMVMIALGLLGLVSIRRKRS
ncbi:MAG: PEP-CTERM sorting domain-containing protein [Planctomycetales bacterium]|nr:PEP-CTERM sorting domain-containing protein [Planctomycetales bacterium]